MKHHLLILSSLLLVTLCCRCTNTPDYVKDKIWLHRANSIEQAKQFQYDYAGLEIDVHYNDSLQTFLIKHDADDSVSLPINEWCRALEDPSQLGIWFDFKNLNAKNCEASLQCLKTLRETYHLNGKLYVESGAYRELPPFREAGFLTSFYIPYFQPDTDDSATYHKHRQRIQRAVNSGVNAISGFEGQYQFMKQEFPEQTKLIWCVNPDRRYLTKVINTIGSDSLVDVLLLSNDPFNR